MIFPDLNDAGQYLVEISRVLISDLNDTEAGEILYHHFKKVMPIEKAAFFFLNEEKGRYDLHLGVKISEGDFKKIGLEEKDSLPSRLKNNPELLFWSASDPETGRLFETTGMQCCFPFLTREKLAGFAFLSFSDGRTGFKQAEKRFLLLVGEQVALAIENIRTARALKKSKVLVRRTDRLKSLETIAGGMAHEIRNPLTSIKTFVELAGERRNDPDFFDSFSKIAKEDIERIERIIREVLDYSRYMEPIFTSEDLNEVIQTTLPFMAMEAAKRGGKFVSDFEPALPRIVVDRQQVKQVLLNLFINAIDALPPANGEIRVKTSSFRKQEVLWARIQIEDNGIGILPEHMENIFDPFFTTKHDNKDREGTGLGLAIVYQIIQDHRGEIDVKSKPKEGTSFFIKLPSNPLLYERRKDRRAQLPPPNDPVS